MKALTVLLEGFEDGQRVLVRLNNGDEFVLYDFEMVDESIYDRDDLVVATISNVISSRFRYRNGTKLEFALGDITSLSDPNTGAYYFYV
jgi:hypothetical protein